MIVGGGSRTVHQRREAIALAEAMAEAEAEAEAEADAEAYAYPEVDFEEAFRYYY